MRTGASDITVHADPAPSEHPVDVVGELPTDSERQESPISAMAFVGIVEGESAPSPPCQTLLSPLRRRGRAQQGRRHLLWLLAPSDADQGALEELFDGEGALHRPVAALVRRDRLGHLHGAHPLTFLAFSEADNG